MTDRLSDPQGTVSLVLHGHLPFVRHPEHEDFLEENWFFEALWETYLPLLWVLQDLRRGRVPFRLSLSLSPTLLAMAGDRLLLSRARRHFQDLLGLLSREEDRLRGQEAFQPILGLYRQRLERTLGEGLGPAGTNPLLGFRDLEDSGHLEVLTCAATHGYLPLLGTQEAAVRAQVGVALDAFQAVWGRKPRGFWLPECAYQPGIDGILADLGVRYSFLEGHGIRQAHPRPPFGTFEPLRGPSGTVFFGRDPLGAQQVWSSKEGYPGDPDYRDFYRDAGFDLEEAALRPFIRPQGIRRFTGLKYFRVTGGDGPKEPYDPTRAGARAREHAAHFLAERVKEAARVGTVMDRPPWMGCFYDAELFGHWWFEGPEFLGALFTRNHREGLPLEFVTPSDYLQRHPKVRPGQPAFSSWGLGGYSEVWLNPSNDWIYPLLYEAAAKMTRAVQAFPKARGSARRALAQAGRELLLAQASDWAFMLYTGNHASYAEGRVRSHLGRFDRLLDGLLEGTLTREGLEKIEGEDPIFPGQDPSRYFQG